MSAQAAPVGKSKRSPRAATAVALAAASVLALTLASCGRADPARAAPPAGVPSSAAPPPAAAQDPPSATPEPASPPPAQLAVPPADCHVEADLPPPAAGAPACRGALALGAAREVVVRPEDQAIGCELLGCDFACGRVEVDGAGAVAWSMTAYLGGGGYTRRASLRVAADGSRTVLRDDAGPYLAAGPEGFLSYGWLPWVVRDGDTATGQRRIDVPWPFQFHGFGPAYYGGPIAFQAGPGGDLVEAVMGVAEDGSAALAVARVGAPGEIVTSPFPVLSLAASIADWKDSVRAEALDDAVKGLAVGRDGAGRFLVLWGGPAACADGGVAGRWFEASGAPRGPVFRAADGPLAGDLVRLPDGSLALQGWGGYETAGAGAWLRRFADGKPAGGPVPSWLASRGGEALRVAGSSGRAVAIQDACARDDRRTRVELLGPGGVVCASALLPRLRVESGIDPCADYGRVAPPAAVGFGGTIAQLGVSNCDDATPGCNRYSCRFELWDGAVR